MTREEFEKIKATRLDIASRKRDSGSFETIQFADAREIDYLLELIEGLSLDGIDEKIKAATDALKTELNKEIEELKKIPKLPIGSMVQFTGAVVPDGWAYCDGSEMADSKFTELKKVIGTQFNNKLPDLDNYIISYK